MVNPSLTDIQVSATNRLVEALQLSEHKMRARINLLVEVVFELNDQYTIVFCNDAWERTLGYPHVLHNCLLDYVHDQDIPLLETTLTELKRQKNSQSLIRIKHADGRLLSMEANFVAMEQGVLGAFHDITTQIDAQSALKRLNQYDVLTELPNRSFFNDKLEMALQTHRADQRGLAIAFLDVDNFKKINDTYGHEFGDQVLWHVAQRIRHTLRAIDIVARFGGDEFTILLQNVESEEVCLSVLSKVLQAFATGFLIDDRQLNVTVTIGVTRYPEDMQCSEQLIRHADQAMYLAKESGKSQINFFDAGIHQHVSAQVQMVEQLKQALSDDTLMVFYQPVMDIHSGHVIGAEALLRWQHPEHGALMPDAFLPRIQDHAIASEIDKYVIQKSLQQMDQWNKQGFPIVMSINVSGVQLQSPDFVEHIKYQLSLFPDIRPQQIKFEVVESSHLNNLEYVCQLINHFKAIGISFALDDFGTGFSSLSHLRELPVDTIKIDKSFVIDMLNNDEDLFIVKGIISLSKAFNCKVHAEGVETADVLEILKKLDCQYAQGFLFSSALPPERFYQAYRQHHDGKNCLL